MTHSFPTRRASDLVMASFLMLFYEGVPPPKLILVDREPAECALVAEALGEAAGRKVEIGVPQRGNRRRLLEQAVRNAGEELDRRLADRKRKRLNSSH